VNYPQRSYTRPAALLSQEGDDLANAVGIDGIQDTALLAPRPQESRPFELCEVRGHGRGGDPELRGNLPSGQPMRGVAHQEPEDFETVFLRQGAKGFNGFFFFHISMIREITNYCKSAAHFCAREFPSILAASAQQGRAYQSCAVRADTLPWCHGDGMSVLRVLNDAVARGSLPRKARCRVSRMGVMERGWRCTCPAP